jgi:Protein of unknown function (DUF3187)
VKTVRTVCLLLLLFFFSPTINAFDGPLQVRNQFPLFLPVNAPSFEKASIEDSFSASFSYSSVYLVQESSNWSAGLDMEIAELNLRFRKTFRDFLEIGVDLPIVSFNSGFMDGFLRSYHDAFGFSDYGRNQRPANTFLYEVRKNGQLIVQGESGLINISDAKLSVKKPILQGDPAISIKGDVEFPTGDAESGYGSGSFDAGISLLLDKKLSQQFKTYVNLGVVFPGDLKGHEKVDLRKFLYGAGALEALMWKDVSIIGQVFFQGSPLPKTGIGQIDRTAVLLSIGGRYHSGNNCFEFSVTEDPNTAGAPDVTFNFAFGRKF